MDENRCDIEKSGFIVEYNPLHWSQDKKTIYVSEFNPEMGYSITDSWDRQYFIRQDNVSSYFDDIENRILEGENIDDMIDLESFATWMLIHDILGTPDYKNSNVYLTKKNHLAVNPYDSKLEAGPLWNLKHCFSMPDSTWSDMHANQDFIYSLLFNNSEFVSAYKQIWETHKTQILDSLYSKFDFAPERVEAIEKSRHLENLAAISPFCSVFENIDETFNWLEQRISSLDSMITLLDEKPRPYHSGYETGVKNIKDNSSYKLNLSGNGVQISGLSAGDRIEILDFTGNILFSAICKDSELYSSVSSPCIIRINSEKGHQIFKLF